MDNSSLMKSSLDTMGTMLERLSPTEQNEQLRNQSASVSEFTIRFLHGEYTDTESIRRTRQKLQEQHPELRGKEYRCRQIEEKRMRDSINNDTLI